MQVIYTSEAPAPAGTYSQALKCGNVVYLSGQIPLLPKTGQLCSDDVHAQIIQVLENLKAVSQAAGGSLANIIKLTVYLVDLEDFSHINKLMSQYFKEPYPTRTTFEVSKLPKGSKVEMDGIMVLP